MFMDEVKRYNGRERQVFGWSLESPNGGRKEEDEKVEKLQRITLSPSVDTILDSSNDLVLGLWLPHNFASYANELVDQSLKDAGLWVDGREKVLRRRVPGPAEVAGQLGEGLQRGRQDGTDRETSDGAHPLTIAA